jgi:hypothetical protein
MALADLILNCLTHIGRVNAIAVGGSTASGHSDRLSDADFFAFTDDENVISAAITFRAAAEAIVPAVSLIDELYLARRFGIRCSVFSPSGEFAEVFFNSPAIFSPMPMTLKMRFISERGEAYFKKNFSSYRSGSVETTKRLATGIFIEAISILRNMLKCVIRGEASGFENYVARLRNISIALELHLMGCVEYDPHAVETKLTQICMEHVIVPQQFPRIDRTMSAAGIYSNFDMILCLLERLGLSSSDLAVLRPWKNVLDPRAPE